MINKLLNTDPPSSEFYDLSIGTKRYFDFCGSVGFICTGDASYRAIEEVVGHTQIDGTHYAIVEWRFYAEREATSPDTEVIHKTEAFYFTMDGNELWMYNEEAEEKVQIYDFGFEPGDSLKQFIDRTKDWEPPFHYEVDEKNRVFPAVVTSDTTIQNDHGETFETVWASEEYEEGEVPVLKALSDSGIGFNRTYHDLFYYVKGMGTWHTVHNHWGIAMVGITMKAEKTYGQTVTVTTAQNDPNQIPVQPELRQNYPNPFNPVTQIEFEVPTAGEVRLEVYDMLGRRVAILLNEQAQAGKHRVPFNASDLSSGMYLYRLQTPNQSIEKNMLFIK
ncbi:MAG: T9SS type A sorting domain-containing protein [Balneolales bacterium]